MIATQSPEGWAAIAAWITAGLIFGGLLFARSQVNEARRLREARVRPFVVVDFEAEPTFIQLTIENVGLLPARDVTLEFDPPLRSTFDDPWPPERSTLLTRGIPTLPPGTKYHFFFDTFPARVEAKLPLTYEARVTYRAFGRKDPFDEPYTLDNGARASRSDREYRCSKREALSIPPGAAKPSRRQPSRRRRTLEPASRA